MQNKKWLFKFIAIAMAVSIVLAGCSTNQGNQQAPANTASEKPASTEPAKPAEPEEKKDISVSIYDRGNVSQDEGTIENNRWTKWINENGPANVKFVAVPRTKPEEKINVLYASGSAPDLLFEYAPKIRDPLYYQKQFLPLDDLIEEHSVEYKQLLDKNPALRKAGTKDGELVYLGRAKLVLPLRGFLIRTDWLENLKLEMPTTTEELYQVIKAFTEDDPDQNGKEDTYGITLSSQTGFNLKQVFGASSWTLKDNSVAYNWDGQEAYHQFAKQLYSEGYVDPDFVNDGNGAKSKQDFITGKLGIYGFLGQDPVKHILDTVDPLKANVATAKVQFMAYPASEQGLFMPTLDNPVQITAAISRTAKNPEAVIKYVDFLVKESTGTALQYGVEGTHYEVLNGCPSISNAEKYKKEVGDLTTDMRMLLFNEIDVCDLPLSAYKSDPRVQEFQEVYDTFLETYFDFTRSYPDLTISEHMPTTPKELITNEGNADKALGDIWIKAIVTANYSVEQALADAKAAWTKLSGNEIEEWYKNWYATEGGDAFLADDIIQLAKEQQAKYETIKQGIK